jgi:hypothetical protein
MNDVNVTRLRQLGISERLIEHLRDYQPSSPLGFHVEPAEHWRSSPIAKRDIIPLWECGVVLTYFDRASATFRMCSLEDIDNDWFRYRSLQPVLAHLFIQLYEDEFPQAQLTALGREIGFQHAERMVMEAGALSREAYQPWADAFPLTCDV